MRESLLKQTFRDFEWLVDINVTGEHDLNKSFNSLIKRAKGELIVFYEDYEKIEEYGLQKFWEAYQSDKNTLWTAPLGKVKEWGNPPLWDWRKERDKLEWWECELDWGAIPKKVLEDIGGFDERLDQWWSMDNVSVGKRAFLLGYKFGLVKDNEAIAYDHDLHFKHPFRDRYNPPEVNAIMNQYENKPRLGYML